MKFTNYFILRNYSDIHLLGREGAEKISERMVEHENGYEHTEGTFLFFEPSN